MKWPTVSSSLPHVIPIQPTLVRDPFHRSGWIYERKEDGWRIVGYKDGSRVRLISRQGVGDPARFPDIATAAAQLPASKLVLDGQHYAHFIEGLRNERAGLLAR